MIRFKALAIASVLLLVGVTACNQQDEQANQTVATPQVKTNPNKAKKAKAGGSTPTAAGSPSASPASTPTTGKTPTAQTSPAKAKTPAAPANTAKATTKTSDGAKPTLTKLNGYLPAAVKALQANDIAQAKQYAKGFNDNWQQKIVQFQVKQKSQSDYNKLASAVTQVNNTVLKPANPDKDKAIASLQALSQAVTEYTKSP
ncbi:MAG TPA: hypothetical protein V6D11_03215 [Waterburya sp.]|jgi:hypothetical protein